MSLILAVSFLLVILSQFTFTQDLFRAQVNYVELVETFNFCHVCQLLYCRLQSNRWGLALGKDGSGDT